MDLLIVFGALASLGVQLRRLPPQNVFAIALLILGMSTGIELLAVNTGVPFTDSLSAKFYQNESFGHVAWPVPLLWVILILLNRNVAKSILARRRAARFYGTEMLLLASILTASCYNLILTPSRDAFLSTNFAGVFFSSAALLLCLTPWLIEKKPHPEP
jgi:uncharacterized membrane protein